VRIEVIAASLENSTVSVTKVERFHEFQLKLERRRVICLAQEKQCIDFFFNLKI
jgi:hypothetical protein